jgi:hypothetical protein
MKIITLTALLATSLFAFRAYANLGDSALQSAKRYALEASYPVSTGAVRYYLTHDRGYIVMQLFNRNEIVEYIMYMRMPRDANTPDPLTQEEMNLLQSINVPNGTTFPDQPLPAALQDQSDGLPGEKLWKSDDGKFYIDLGTLTGEMAPPFFGMTIDIAGFCTAAGMYNMTNLIHTGEWAKVTGRKGAR